MAPQLARGGVRRSAYDQAVRDRDAIDSELRLVAAVRRTCAELGGAKPTTAVLDGLLDERNAGSRDAGG
ncbi:Uncharacterised protein [Mycobacteroides abscessus subsp. massiliense]|nr:Uncharacterised protein [Mycobacteroides abscessus subsp. massiliense]